MAEMYKVVRVADLESGLKEIESFIDLQKVRGVLAVVGESPSGKTTLMKRFLRNRGLSEDEYYINLNDFIMTALKKRQDFEALELDDRRSFLQRNRRIIEKMISEKLRDHFENKGLLVLDSIELLFKYGINLSALAFEPSSGGKTCIMCVPGSVSGDKIYFMGKPGIIGYHHCDRIIQIERKE